MRSADLGIIEGIEQEFSEDFHLQLFRRANYTHLFELEVKKAFDNGAMKIPIYLSMGSEFNSAALSLCIQGYHLFAQHRCHGLYLSFGGKPEALRDELLGLASGCCGGMSGSNAIQAPEANMFGHSGLLGEQVPIAVGAAYGSKYPTLSLFGDAAVEEDYIYPSLGWAATHQLPVLFICEDNDLSVLTKTEVRRNWSACKVAESLGIPAVDISDDPWLIAHHVNAMKDNLPAFINIRTVRHLWHSGTGSDGAPEWDRYQVSIEKMRTLGLGAQLREIEAHNQTATAQLWQSARQKP